MITDHTIVSARAEMGKKATKDRRFIRRLIAACIGTALAMPALAAWGMDSPHNQQPSDRAVTSITLPPVPYIDSIPWMKWDTTSNAFKTDLLLSPTLRWGIDRTPQADDKQKLSAN
ncbi:hypothetical protein J6524_24280 [Bradyrhizobium sp. WSM 1738]|uniref:hypothetical protein n=1 Tax=Bradyrhizobium hereditatis TaxID=2821405 RepID=UPI001CE262FC|nr:hypothetical protein [Bradyrhizobium hereditatis]MCA6117971.1 hypothetical protein [Bradyrhizobium hereditatis]